MDEHGCETCRTLLSEGLDLCVRARKIDAGLMEQNYKLIMPASVEAYPEVWAKSGTPHLWVQEQYDSDLTEWEQRSRHHLMHECKD